MNWFNPLTFLAPERPSLPDAPVFDILWLFLVALLGFFLVMGMLILLPPPAWLPMLLVLALLVGFVYCAGLN